VSGTTAGRPAGQLAGRPAGRLAGWLRTSVQCPAGELATTRWLAQSAGAMPKLIFFAVPVACLWLSIALVSDVPIAVFMGVPAVVEVAVLA